MFCYFSFLVFFNVLTFQLVIQVLQNDSDHLDQRQDERTKSQGACVVSGGWSTKRLWASNTVQHSRRSVTPPPTGDNTCPPFHAKNTNTTHTNASIQPLTGGPGPRKRRWGWWECLRASWKPNNTRRRPPPGWPGPGPSQSWHTRRTGKRCRTGTGWGICGRGSPRHRRQTSTLHPDTRRRRWRCWKSAGKRTKKQWTEPVLMWISNMMSEIRTLGSQVSRAYPQSVLLNTLYTCSFEVDRNLSNKAG